MKVFCPNCGSDNEGVPGGRVTCRACTAAFEVPRDSLGGPGPAAPMPGPQSQPPRPAAMPAATPTPQGWVQPQVNPPVGQPPLASWSQPPAAAAQTNTLAIISLIAGILCCVPLASIAAVIMGAIALRQINESGGAQKGKELALIGLILGALGTLGTVAYIILAIIGGIR